MNGAGGEWDAPNLEFQLMQCGSISKNTLMEALSSGWRIISFRVTKKPSMLGGSLGRPAV